MKLVADESVDGPIVARLRADGHDVVYIAELSPGMSDDDVLLEASSRKAILHYSRQGLWGARISSGES
jgi:hypothetical protein